MQYTTFIEARLWLTHNLNTSRWTVEWNTPSHGAGSPSNTCKFTVHDDEVAAMFALKYGNNCI